MIDAQVPPLESAAAEFGSAMTQVDADFEVTADIALEMEDFAFFRNLFITAASQSTPVSEDGDFTLNNIPTNQGLIRLRLQQIPGVGTIARTPFFEPVTGQTISADLFEIIDPRRIDHRIHQCGAG